jgi:hypothetical protein
MIERLIPPLLVETPAGKGNAVFFMQSESEGNKYWIINSIDNSMRIFSEHEVHFPAEYALWGFTYIL